MRWKWAAGGACGGILLTGAVVACYAHATPDRPAAREWPQYAVLLYGPYALASVGCALSARRFVRALTSAALAAGALMALAVAWDTVPVLLGAPAPAVFGSALACGTLLVAQYRAGALAMFAALAARSVDRASGAVT